MTSLKSRRERNILLNNFLKYKLYFLNLQPKLETMKDGQTIGQWLKWDFKTNGYLEIKNKNGKRIYYEHSIGFWTKREYDSQGNKIYWENSDGFWEKCEYDSDGTRIYYEDSSGFWVKRECDSQGNEIYFEDSTGIILDSRPPEVIEHNGRKYKLIP
jgi:hypothetical protein